MINHDHSNPHARDFILSFLLCWTINGHVLHIFSAFFSAKAAPWLAAMAKVPKYSRPGCWCSAWPGRPKGHSWFFSGDSTKKSLGVPRVIDKGGRECQNVTLCSIEIQRNEGLLRFFHVLMLPQIQFQFFWAAFEKDPGRSFPRARTCADDSAQKLGATPHLHSIYQLVGSWKNWKHLASSSTLSLERSFSSSM